MADSVALNEVVRVLGTELSKNDERVLIGSTEEEKAVLQKHSSAGKRRAVMGFIAGSSMCAGVWKAMGGQRRLLGGFTMASGGMAGFMYGILSIRRGLFEDILTLPSDKSPFAHRARQILDEQLPSNAFYLEVKQVMKQQGQDNGSWDAVPAFPNFKPATSDDDASGFREFNRSTAASTPASSLPRLPPLPQSDDEHDSQPTDNEAFTAPSTSSSPFFFGGSSDRESSRTNSPPLSSYDSYDSRPPVTKKPQDDDPYYNSDDGWGNEGGQENKPKPVTWEELRRRAGNNKQ